MTISSVSTGAAATPAGPYSLAVVANGFIFVSGQRPVKPDTGELAVGLREQAHQVLRNLSAVLEAAGSGLGKVVRVNIYLDDIAAFEEVNKIYTEYFHEPFPARTTVACSLRGILIEIDAIAVT